ncbi:hypothetical protein ABL78_3350 [Leptomonas seymouri]|uniref:Uncharacterized protein n=1 Tax=Leptomonas seymouri TaxID=5684 RepID=A0A0N1IL20_LEPSE|nr:hypothetical protein ABL78_3350 [Leptomonas seymouri]|eukprot:KPI87553.1 hypothetical protein ABL78_3350 [Leptomonas seymouri]
MTQTSSSPTGVVFHALPVQTDFAGTTDVHENFTSVMAEDSTTHLWHATLRGRRLLGTAVQLPDDYAVALVATAECPAGPSPCFYLSVLSEAREKESTIEVPSVMLVEAAAPSYVQWEHDRPPAAAATVPQWIALASILHASD